MLAAMHRETLIAAAMLTAVTIGAGVVHLLFR